MSFILDALKKSESDRQRQNGPALYEVKVAAPRSQLPLWAIGLAVLLGINLIIVAWALLKHSARPEAAPPVTAATAVPQPAPQAAPAAQQAPAAANAAAPASTRQSLPVPQAVTTEPTVSAAGLPTSPGHQGASGSAGPGQTAGAARKEAPQQANPDDYEPATEPSPPTDIGFHARQGTAEGVPLYSQVVGAAGNGPPLPQLRLDLHAYAARPEDRFVLINMKKVREGDSLPEGVKVESITPDGVILSHNGTRFLLPRD
jgi:general secretion pathway protein B